MNIRQHLIPVSVKKIIHLGNNKVINLVKNYLPPRMYKRAQSNVILEQQIGEVLPVYKEAIDYIICQIRSTIQHEAQHRAEEMDWQQSDPERRITFEELTDPTKAEIGPERAEESCVPPEMVSGQTEQTTINDLFEKAKGQSNIDPSWKPDIMAATLAEGRAGQYLMKNLSPDDLQQVEQIDPGIFRQGNNLLIDVRKHVEPWIAERASLPSVVQTPADGAVTPDADLPKADQQGVGTVPTAPSVGSVPNI